MRIRKMTLATALSMALAAPMALAADNSMDNEGSSKADRKDATMESDSMSKSHEGMAMQRPSFEELDTNSDGIITEDELNVYGSTAAGQAATDSEAERNRMTMEGSDTNNDGKITRKEFKDGADHDAETDSEY